MYLIWCKVALVVTIIVYIIRLSESPIRKKNMEKIYCYYEIWRWNYRDVTKWDINNKKPSMAKNIIFSIWDIIFNVLLSWISVVFTVRSFIYKRYKNQTVPDDIKKLNFKLEHSLLEKHEVQEVFRETMMATWIKNETIFNLLNDVAYSWKEYEDYIWLTHDNDWDPLISIWIAWNIIFNSISGMYRSIDSVLEFKINGKEINIKLLQQIDAHVTLVKDWVICEHEVSDYQKKELEKYIKWHEATNLLWKALIFKNQLSESSFNKYVQEQLKEIEKAEKEYKNLCKKYWIDSMYKKDWSFRFFMDYDKVDWKPILEKEEYEKFTDEASKIWDKRWFDIWDTKFIIQTLQNMLENK